MKIEAEFDGKRAKVGEGLLDNKMANVMGQFQGFLQAIMLDMGQTKPNTFKVRLINDDNSYMEFGKGIPTNNE